MGVTEDVSVPIGSNNPVECFVYHDALDAAATLSELIDEPLSELPRTQILNIDAGTFGALPYLYQERLYLTEQKAAALHVPVAGLYSSALVSKLPFQPPTTSTCPFGNSVAV